MTIANKYGHLQTRQTRQKIKLHNARYWKNKIKTIEHIQQISNTLKGRKLSEEHKQNIGKAEIGRKQSKKWIDNRVTSRLKNGNYKHSEKFKELAKIRSIHQFKNGMSEKTKTKLREWNLLHPNRIFKDTKTELKVEAELQKRHIKYIKQQPLCKTAIVDFYLPEQNIVIECDGCFYHACKIHGNSKCHQNIPEKDTKKTKLLTENGFNVYRFWGHEIDENVSNCINKLKIACQNI